MRIGVVADDFTGASDIANTLAKRRRPHRAAPRRAARVDPDGDAGVVALKSRSIPAADAVAQSLEAADWLRGQGASSSSSSTARPSIRRLRAISARSPKRCSTRSAPSVALVCPAFPDDRRTVYQGHLFVGDRLLSEMRHGEPPADADDRPRPPPLAAPADQRARSGHLPLADGARRRAARAAPRGRGRRARRAAGRRRRDRRHRPHRARAALRRPRARHRRLGHRARPAGELRRPAAQGAATLARDAGAGLGPRRLLLDRHAAARSRAYADVAPGAGARPAAPRPTAR